MIEIIDFITLLHVYPKLFLHGLKKNQLVFHFNTM